MNLPAIHGANVTRAQLFSGKPYSTVQFPTHVTRVDQLPAWERNKIYDAAEFVARSYYNPQLAGGFVIAIGIRAYADPDLTRTGVAQSGSEKNAAQEYANEVAAALTNAMKMRTALFGAESMLVGEPFEFVIECMGAKMAAQTHAPNGRVEIFLYLDKMLFLEAKTQFDLPPQKRLPD